MRRCIDETCPALVVCGHIHESCGVAQLGATQMVNCGTAYEGHYAVAELDSGVHVELRKARMAGKE